MRFARPTPPTHPTPAASTGDLDPAARRRLDPTPCVTGALAQRLVGLASLATGLHMAEAARAQAARGLTPEEVSALVGWSDGAAADGERP